MMNGFVVAFTKGTFCILAMVADRHIIYNGDL